MRMFGGLNWYLSLPSKALLVHGAEANHNQYAPQMGVAVWCHVLVSEESQ